MYRSKYDIKNKGKERSKRVRCRCGYCVEVLQGSKETIRDWTNRDATMQCKECGFKRVFRRIPKKHNRER